jgi:succinylglutamic semialdehyde dehydrogenase
MPAKSLYIDGVWRAGEGLMAQSINPATGHAVWEGASASEQDVERAVDAARGAQEAWGALPVEKRIERLEAFATQLKGRRAELAESISKEIGKPLWESLTEVDAMIGKVPVSIQAWRERRLPVEKQSAGLMSATRFKPHGVVAVFGPFNFPGHLPNGHIVPALLAGNTVVFKPSEAAPLTAQVTMECWHDAGVPRGAINLVQGARQAGMALSKHPGIDGLFFTGSASVGIGLRKMLAQHPEKILALEMGGNNPLIVYQAADVLAAAYITIQSAFITSGQRCTCARRLIVCEADKPDGFLDRLVEVARSIRVGAYTDNPEPFMGPVISEIAGERLLSAQKKLMDAGGKSLLEMRSLGGQLAMLSPGIVDVTAVESRADEEHFGPLLQVIRVKDFSAAVVEANNTAYGLAAGLISDRRENYELFFRKIRAGVVNFNRPTTGASGSLPFGGVGLSGNHRPSGFYAADYCSYPIASMESDAPVLPAQLTPGITLDGRR